MEDNTNQVVDPFTSLPMERGEKPVDPFTGKPITSVKPRSTLVTSPQVLATYGKNDYRDYNVNLRPGVDINEQRAQNQSRWEQWGRGLTKLGSTALSVGIEGPVGLVNGIGEALYHQDIDRLWNNTTGKYVDEFNEWMDATLPIYKTKAEQEAIGFENLGNATFWAQDFTNGVGYAVGALAGGGIALKGLKLGTKALRYGAKGLLGADKMSDVHNVMKAVQRGEDVGTTVTNIARKNYVQNAAERFAVGASMTHAESSVEARDMFKSAEQTALQTMADEKGVSVADLSRADRREAKDIASRVSNMGYLLNTALIGTGNWIQFGKVLRPSFRQMRPVMKGITKVGGQYAEQSLARRVAGNIAERPLKNFFTEAGEEGGQFLVAQAADDLAAARSSMGPTSGPQDWAEALGGAWADLDTKEGLDSLLLGALVGAFTGGGHNVFNRISGASAKESGRRKLAIEALNNPQIYNLGERAKAVAQNDMYINLMNKALEEGDHKGYRDAIFNLLTGEVMMHDNLGTIKYYRNLVEDAGNMSKEEFAKAFGIPEGVDFNPREIINGVNDKIDEFLDIKERIDVAVPGKPNNRTIGDWINGANTEEEKRQREDEEVYRNMLYQYTWQEKDIGKRMQSLVDELNAATFGKAVTEEVLDAPLTVQELQEEGKPITETAELLGKKPYVSMTKEAQKKLQDAVDRIQDPLLRAEMQIKKDDLVNLSNDRARAVFALEELLSSPEQRVAAIERRRAAEKAAGEEQIRAKAEDVINSTVTEAQLEAFTKTSEFADLPPEVQARVREEQTKRHNQEVALKKQHAEQPLKEMQNRLDLINNLETKTPAQELEALILQQSIDARREDPTKEPAPAKPKPEEKTEDTKGKKKNTKQQQKKRADAHTKRFRDATDPVEKLTAAHRLLNHFNLSQERGIDSMLDPDVLLEVNDTIEELKKEGYEIIDLKGQKYDDGLLLEADFIPDETLKEGERIIDFVYEPEIRKDGKLIKAAKVRVKQSVSKVAKGDGSTKTPTPTEEGKPATVKLMGGEFENDNGRIVLDDAGNPVPGLDATKPFEIDRNFVKTPEGVKTLQEKGVEFKMSPVYDFTYPDGKPTGKKGRAILVFVPGTDTIIGILPDPKKDKTSATIAKLLETQDSVPGKVENFMFGGAGNFIQGAPLVPAADVIDLKTDAVAAIGIVKERNVIFGQTIEGREFGDLQTRRLRPQRFSDGQAVMAIQYPNGQFGTIPFSTLDIGQEGVDYLKEQLNKGVIDEYTIENIRIKMGIARELKPNNKMVIFQSQDNGILFRFMLGEHVIQMTADNVRKMLNIGQFEWTTGKLVEDAGEDGRINYKFETNDSITRAEQIEIQKQLVGGSAFSDIVRSSKRQVDEELLEINPKNFVGLNGVTHPDYYTYLMKDILRTDTRFVNGLPTFDVGIEMSIDAQVSAEQAVEQTELKKQSGPKRTTAPAGGAGSLKPKKGKRQRRGAASKVTPTAEPKAPESNQTEITYKNNTYVVTFEGLGGKNTIVNKKTGKEILSTSSVGKNVMDLWEAQEEGGTEIGKEQLLAKAAEIESRIIVLQAIISEGGELTPEQNEEYDTLESELYDIMTSIEPPYEEDNVPFRLEEDRLAQDVLLDLLERYGFEINEADNLLINLAAKRIDLNTMDNAQVAEALATPLSRMIMESDDSDQLRKAIRNSIKFPLRADKARSEVQAERDKIKRDKIANGIKFREESFDKQTKEEIAKAEERVVDSILVDLLKEGFDKKLAAETGIDRSLYKKIKAFIDKIIDYLRGALSQSVKEDLAVINEKVQLVVENSFMPGEFIKLQKKPGHTKVDFQEAFNGDRAAHLIQTELSKNPDFILTGSIAFAAQGSTYRSGNNIIHDLDYVVLGDGEEGSQYLEKKFPAAQKVYGPFNPGGADITTYLVPPGIYKISNLQRMRDIPNDNVPPHKTWTRKTQGRGSGKVVYYELRDIESDEVVGTFYLDVELDAEGNIVTEVEIKEGITGMFIDLFANSTHGLDYVEQPFKGVDGVTRDVKLSRFDIPFGAKLLMGRNKDIWDYNRYIPKERVGVRRPRKTIDPAKAKSWVEQRFGEGSAVVFDTVQKVDNAVVHGYMENAAVHLWSNAELGTEYHEGFHLFFRTMLSDKQRQQLYDEMLEKYGEPSVKAIAKARRGKPNLSDAEARFLALEEKMAEDFRLAQINKEVPSTIGGKIAKFFRDLMYYIKALVTDRIGVQQAFHMLGENRIPTRFSRTAEKFSPGRAFMMRNYALDPDTHKELVDTATYLIREAISNNQFDVEAALGTKQTVDVVGGDSAVRDWFLRNSYHVADESGLGIGRPLTNQEFKRLKEAYDSENEEDLDAIEEELNLNAWAPTTDINGNAIPLGMQGFDATTLDEQDSLGSFMTDEVIGRAEDNAEQFRMVYDYWHDEFNELGGRAITGFRSDIVEALKSSGITIRDEELVEEDDEGADKIYTKTNFEVDPASKLGKDFKILLSSIPVENPEQSRFGFRRYMYWKDIYNEMAGTVANANNFVEMVEMLGKRGNDVSTMKHVADWVANLPANQQALLYAMLSQSMTEHRLIMIEPSVAEGAVDTTALVKIINSSVSSNQRYFRELWKDKSTSIDGVYKVNVSTDGTETVLDTQMDQDVANRLQEYLKEYDNPGTTLMRKQELVATMMMDMGLTIAPSLKEAVVRLNDYLSSNGIPVDEFFSNQTRHTNLRQIISTQMAPGKSTYSNVFVTEGRTMDYVAREIMGRYESPKLSSFYNAFGELRYPLNLTTDFHLTTRAVKSGEYAELMTDAAGHHSGDKGTLAYMLASNEQFRELFDIVDIESIKYVFRGEDQIKEYQDMSYLEALAIDLAMFNRDMNTRMIAVDTQADRPKLSYTTIPNLRSAKARQIFGITEFGDSPVESIARRTYLMDLHRMFVSFGSGSIDNPIMRYHEGGALKFQLGGQLEPDTIFTSNYDLMRDAYDAVEHGMEESKLLREFLDKEVQGFTARLEGYTQDIIDKVGGSDNISLFIQQYVQPKNGYIRGQEIEFLRDFVGMSVIGRLVSREFLRSGINYTKDGAAYVKRSGHSSTPGYLLAMRGTLSDPEYGMPPTFNEITVRDLISSISPTEFDSLRNALIKQLAPADAAFGADNTYDTLSDESRAIIDRLLAPYGRNNGTDAQAFVTIDMYRFIQQGLGVWDNFEERAYQQYISAPKGQRVWTGKPIKAMKPSYDYRNVVMINGKKHLVPIVHKNSYVVLTDQLVEGIPNMMNLLNYMETNDVQVANTDSAKKLGSFMPVDITDLSNAKIQTLDSRGLKFPQILPRKKKQEITFGRQPRKTMVANIQPNEIYVVDGVKMTGRQMIDLYFKAVTGRLKQGHNAVMSRLGLDAIQAAPDLATKRQAVADAMVNIREVVAELGIEKTFTQNFLDSLEVVADADGTVTSALPFSFPTLGPKLENVIMSMFRNEAYLMKLPGQEMVQFAEFGAHERDGSLKFYEVDGDRVIGAQVDIGYDVLKRMGIDPDAPVELIQEGLDELLGYRIPLQSKASMYVLKIRNVIKGEHSGIIRVPPATTTLMGSDFDVDKLFVMFPELEVIRNEKGEAVRVQKVKPDYKGLLSNMNDIDFTELDPKILNNIVFDTFYAVGSDVKHLTETTAVMDLEPEVDPIIQAMEMMGRPTTVKIDINSPHDRLLSGENNMLSMRLRGIYANAVAGRNVLETLVNVYGLAPKETNIVFESNNVVNPGEEIMTSEIVIDGFTYQSDQVLSMYLSRAVDSVNDPIQAIINDNATTAPLTVFMLSAGFTPQEAILFLNVPAVKSITDAARAEGMTVKNYMREMYGDMPPPPSELVNVPSAEKIEPDLLSYEEDPDTGEITLSKEQPLVDNAPTVILLPELEDMAAVIQASDRGEKLPDNYDENYYFFALQQMAGKAARLQNYHSLLSPDNIDQKGTIPLHQEMMDKSMNLRDDLFGGMVGARELITKVLEPDAEGNRSYELIGGFYDAGKLTLDMMGELGFVANQPGVEVFKRWLKSATNKKYLNEIQHRDINRMITHHIYTKPGSPIFESGVLDYDFVESTFFDGGIQNIILGMRNAVGTGENIVLNTLLPTTEVINGKEFTYLKFNIAALDDIGKNQFTMLLDEMITNPSLYGEQYTPIVQMFTRAVISNSVITSGFTAGPTSYFNLIPQSYWNSLTNSSGEDFRTHANRNIRELGSNTALLSEFQDAFLINYATHIIGRSVLFSSTSHFGVGSTDTISLPNKKAEFVVATDTETNHKYLFQRFSDDGTYKKVRTKGKQYRLNETYLRGSNGLPTQVSLITGVYGSTTILPPAQSRRLDLDMPKETESGYRAKVSRLRSSFAKAGIDVTVQEGPLPKGIKAEVEGNVVTVDPSQITEDTTYHEFGHILLDMLPEDELDKYIADIRRLRPDLAKVVTDAYPDLQGRALGKEILTTAIGIEGARIERKNPSKLRMLINRIMRAIGRVFGVRPDPAVVLAEEMFGKQIRREGVSGVFSDAIQRSIELQGRIQKVYTQVNSSLKRQKAKLQGRKDTETQKQKLKEVQAQLNSLEAIKNKALVNQEEIDDFFNFQQFVLNKAESIENTLNDLLETEHKALTRSEIYSRLKIIDSLREDIDSLFSTTTENSAIFQMSQLIQNLNFDETASEEVKEVLRDLDSAARRLADSREVYLDAIIPMMSKLLLSYADPMLAAKIQKLKNHVMETKDISGYRLTSTTNSPDLKKLKAEYRKSQSTTEPMTMDEYKAKALEIKLRDLDNKIPGKQQLDAELRRAHVQKSGYAAMIDPIVYSNEMNVQLLANALRVELQEADNNTVDYVYDLEKVYEPFKVFMGGDVSPSALNKKLVTTKRVPLKNDKGDVTSYMEVLALEEPFNTRDWYTKRAAALKEIAEKTNRPKRGAERWQWVNWNRSFDATTYNSLYRQWYEQNSQPVPNAEKIWNGWNVDLQNKEGELQQLEAESNPETMDRRSILQVEIDALKKRIRNSRNETRLGVTYLNELAMPSDGTNGTVDYRNPAYAEIMQTPELKTYYEFLRDRYFAAQKRIGKSDLFVNAWDDHSYVLPSVRKNTVEDVRRKDFRKWDSWKKLGKEIFVNPFVRLDTDTEYGVMTDVDGDRIRHLPRYFTNLVPATEVTTDLAQSMTMFEHMSHQYEAKAKMTGLVNGMLAAHEAKGAMATVGGLGLIDRFKTNRFAKVLSKDKVNKELEHLRAWIDTVYYGELKESALVGKFDFNKLSSGMQRATAANSLMLNTLQIFNQGTLDNFQIFTESVAGEFWSIKDAAWAITKYATEGAAFGDTAIASNKLAPKTKLAKVMQSVDAMVDIEEQLRNIKGNKARKIFSTNTGYAPQRGVEHQTSALRMLALMKATVPLDKDGNRIEIDGKVVDNIYDAFIENEKGRAVLDPRVANVTVPEITGKLRGISKRTNQVKGTFDRSMADRHWFFSMLMLFRNYIPGNIRKTFGHPEGYHVDHELGQVTRGAIPSLMSAVRNVAEGLGPDSTIADGWAATNEIDRANLKRVAVHMLGYMAAGMIFASLEDDDDEYINVFTAYQARRLQTEITGFLNPHDFFRMVQRPLATSNTVLNWLDLMVMLFMTGSYGVTGAFEDSVLYQRRQGKYNKGDLKLYNKFNKVLPTLNGWQTAFWTEGATENVAQKIKWFNL